MEAGDDEAPYPPKSIASLPDNHKQRSILTPSISFMNPMTFDSLSRWTLQEETTPLQSVG